MEPAGRGAQRLEQIGIVETQERRLQDDGAADPVLFRQRQQRLPRGVVVRPVARIDRHRQAAHEDMGMRVDPGRLGGARHRRNGERRGAGGKAAPWQAATDTHRA